MNPTHYACKFCVAMYGLKVEDVCQLPKTPEAIEGHITAVHQYPMRSARAILGEAPMRIRDAKMIEATGAILRIRMGPPVFIFGPVLPRRVRYWVACFSAATAMLFSAAYVFLLTREYWLLACLAAIGVLSNVHAMLVILGIAQRTEWRRKRRP